MATYYVKTGGNDEADGLSDGNAWATVAKVVATTLSPDDNVYFNRGDGFTGTLTVGQSGTEGHPITYGSYGTGALPTLQYISTGWNNNKNYITIENLRVTDGGDNPGIFSTRTTGWTISGVTVDNVGRTGIQMRSATNCTISDCTITGNRDADPGWRGIYFYYEDDDHPGSGNTVSGCAITYWGGYGVQFIGSDSDHRTTDVTCINNDLSHCTTGCYVSYADGGEVAYNICNDNVQGGDDSVEQYGIALQSSSNINIHHNTITDGHQGMEIWAYDGTGSWPDSGPSDGNTVHHNLIARNANYGFLIYEGNCDDTEIYSNLIYDNADAGIQISEAKVAGTGNVINNNTLYCNNTDNAGYADLYMSSIAEGWTVKNNVFYNTDRLCLRITNASWDATHANNLYYRASGNVVDNDDTTYTSATITNFEATAQGGNPLFTSITEGAEDFRPLTGSPCINNGDDTVIWAGFTDYDGMPPYGTVDIGAYEAVAAPASTYLKNELLDHVFKTAEYTPPTNIYIVLSTSTIDSADTGGSVAGEVTEGGYERKACNSWDAAFHGLVYNTNAVTYSQATADWGTLTDMALVDGLTTGNVLLYGKLVRSIPVDSGDTLTLPAGSLKAGLA